jgi:hypothetical protein
MSVSQVGRVKSSQVNVFPLPWQYSHLGAVVQLKPHMVHATLNKKFKFKFHYLLGKGTGWLIGLITFDFRQYKAACWAVFTVV